MPTVVDQTPPTSPWAVALAIAATAAFLGLGVALPAYLTWDATRDSGWAWMAGIGGFLVSLIGASAFGIAHDLRANRRSGSP